MERHEGQFEHQSREGHRQACQQEQPVAAVDVPVHGGDLMERQGARHRIQERYTEQQERRRHAGENQVFQCSLEREEAPGRVGDERVDRDTQQLQAEKERGEMGAGDQCHRAQRGQQQQDEELIGATAALPEIIESQQGHAQTGQNDNGGKKQGIAVHHDEWRDQQGRGRIDRHDACQGQYETGHRSATGQPDVSRERNDDQQDHDSAAERDQRHERVEFLRIHGLLPIQASAAPEN